MTAPATLTANTTSATPTPMVRPGWLDVTSASDGSAQLTTVYVHTETPTERATRKSDEYADAAMRYGLQGIVITSEICAECAELYALLASQLGNAERLDWAMR